MRRLFCKRRPQRLPARVGRAPALPTCQAETLHQQLLEGFLALERRFEETFARDTVREQHLTKLHDEVQEYKRGLLHNVQRPYLMGLIQLHDGLGRTVEHLLAHAERTFSAHEAAELLHDFRDDLELLMQHNALEPFQEPGSTFAPARQTSLKTVPTDDPALAGQVAARLRPGFEQQGHVVQKERVTVYTCQRGSKA